MPRECPAVLHSGRAVVGIGSTMRSSARLSEPRSNEPWLWLFSEYIVDLPHDSVGPLNRGSDHRLRSRAWLGIEQIISSLQVPGDENPRHNGKHAFAAFVHYDILPLSPFVRPLSGGILYFARSPVGQKDAGTFPIK